MKRILIVNKSFALGGIQSSMVNMANELSKRYEVDLFVYYPVGAMKERLCDKVRLLPSSWRFRALGMSLKDAVRSKDFRVVTFRVFATVWSKLFSNDLPIRLAIRHQEKLGPYDLAIAFHHERGKKSVTSGFSRLVSKCVEANRKVAWVHYDCNILDLDSAYNNTFYADMDRVVCVSRSLKEVFVQKNPELKKKADYCYNFMLYDTMREQSKLPQGVPYPADRFICFSACRLFSEKAIVRSVHALAEVFHKYPDVMWFIAGDGPERSNIEQAIRSNGLDDRIVLLGNQSNPYPYLKNADLMMNVSFHEAAPMTFLESKAMGTPVFAAKTSSTDELLNDMEDSFVCENSEIGIREKFAWLMEHRDYVRRAKDKLSVFSSGNEDSLRKIESFITE